MTEKKQPTKEEIEKYRANNIKKTLEWKIMQDSVGSNLVKSYPHKYTGQLGLQSAEATYQNTMNGEDSQKIKTQIYNEKLNRGKSLGVAGEPAYPTNYDLSVHYAQQLEEVLSMAKLSEIEKYAKNLGHELDYEIPEELKNYSKEGLMKIIQERKAVDSEGKIDTEKLDKKEIDALGWYQTLSEFYKRSCALNTTNANYFADLNEQAKQLSEDYKPKNNSKEKKE